MVDRITRIAAAALTRDRPVAQARHGRQTVKTVQTKPICPVHPAWRVEYPYRSRTRNASGAAGRPSGGRPRRCHAGVIQ